MLKEIKEVADELEIQIGILCCDKNRGHDDDQRIDTLQIVLKALRSQELQPKGLETND